MVPVALALLVLAQPVNPYLDEGRRLAKELKFAECINQMKIAGQVLDFPKAERLEILTLLGRCQIAEGQRARAEDSFVELLELAPNTELNPNESPKILEVFEAVKRRLYPPDYVKLSPRPARAGNAVFRLVDPWRQVDKVVMLRRVSETTEELPLTEHDEELTVELDVAAGRTLDWWLEARSVSGQVLAGFGSSQGPQRYSVPVIDTGPQLVDSRSPRLQRIPAWVSVIVAVAAVSAGAVLQVESGIHAAQARDSTRYPGDWSDTARATQTRAVGEATWATGLFIGACIAGSAGLVLFVW